MTIPTLTIPNAPPTPAEDASAGMGQIVVVSGAGIARAVVGSCIALALIHAGKKLVAFAHIVLPSSNERGGPPGKFANTAIPYMIEALADEGARQADLVAKMVGGASMFASGGPIQIGPANQASVTSLLDELRIPIVGRHVGGNKGRRIICDAATGALTIEIVGEAPTIL